MKRRVSLVRGQSRCEGIAAALDAISGQIDLAGARCVLVKPNFVSVSSTLASTQVDGVRAVLDFVRARYDGRVVVGEGAALSPTCEGFRNLGYESLVETHGIELVDFNAADAVEVQVYDRRMQPMTLHLARTAVEADYRISVGPPKTHDTVIVTLSIKNMVMGSLINRRAVRQGGGNLGLVRRVGHLMPRPVRQSGLAEWAKGRLLGGSNGSSKMAMHQGFPAMNVNLARVAPHVWPHLAVIDGWQGMEGNGPGAGDPVDWRVALAGTDALAVDVFTAHLMGFDPETIGYFQHCRWLGLGSGDLDQIEVAGDLLPEEARRDFRPHPTTRRQMAWQLDGVERYLEGNCSGNRLS